MVSKLIGALLLSSLPFAAQAADIYKWTDEEGRVTYGNVVPERYKRIARKVDLGASQVAVVPPRRAPAEESSAVGSGTPAVPPRGTGY